MTGLAVAALLAAEPVELELVDPELAAAAEPDDLVLGAALVPDVVTLTLAVLCLASAGS